MKIIEYTDYEINDLINKVPVKSYTRKNKIEKDLIKKDNIINIF